MTRLRLSTSALVAPALAFLLVAFLYPVGRLSAQSFTGLGGDWPSLQQFSKLVSDPFIVQIFGRTIAIGFISTFVCLIAGLPLAAAYVYAGSGIRSVVLICVLSPLLINHVVRTYGWTVILGKKGVLFTFLEWLGFENPPTILYTNAAVVIGLVSVFTPFMVLTLIPALGSIDRSLYSASRSLGAGSVRTFFAIAFPLLRPGVVSGSVLVFTLTQGAFVVPLMLGGSGVQLAATLVYNDAMVLFNWPRATAVSVVLLVVVLIITAVERPASRNRWSEQHDSRSD